MKYIKLMFSTSLSFIFLFGALSSETPVKNNNTQYSTETIIEQEKRNQAFREKKEPEITKNVIFITGATQATLIKESWQQQKVEKTKTTQIHLTKQQQERLIAIMGQAKFNWACKLCRITLSGRFDIIFRNGNEEILIPLRQITSTKEQRASAFYVIDDAPYNEFWEIINTALQTAKP